MEQRPPFSHAQTETELSKLSCESMEGKRSSLVTSSPFMKFNTARSPTQSPTKSISSGNSLQPMSCSLNTDKIPNSNSNPNPNCSPCPHPWATPGLNSAGRNLSTVQTPNPNSAADHVHMHPSLNHRSISGCNLTADQSPSPSPNLNPYLNPSTTDSLLLNDFNHKYSNNSSLSAEGGSLNHSIFVKNDHQHEQSLLDDHSSGFISDDQIFGGFKLLPAQAFSPLFSEGLQAAWSPMFTDHLHITISKQALMSPAPEIAGLGDLQEAEISSFSGMRRWSPYEEVPVGKELPGGSGLPPTAAIPGDSQGCRPPESFAFPSESRISSVGKYTLAVGPAAVPRDDKRHPPRSPASAGDSADVFGTNKSAQYGTSAARNALDDTSCDDQHRPSLAFSGIPAGSLRKSKMAQYRDFPAGNAEAGVPAGDGGASSIVDMSSSSASEAQEDDEGSNISTDTLVGAPATYENLDTAEVGTPPADHADNKPLKKPRKKGQKRVRQARVALLTKSEVEHLEDGYRWRKYGQKAVKNSPHPRSYYRCTNSKCFVKKRVERCNEDPSLVVTTYEGKHTHQIPALLRGSNMLEPNPYINILNNNNVTTLIPLQSSLMSPSIHSPSAFSTANITPNYLFRPLIPSPTLIPRFPPSKPLSFPTNPLSIPSLAEANAARNMAMQLPQLTQALLSTHQNFMQANAAPTEDDAPRAFQSPLVDKGLLDDMFPLACAARKPSSSPSS